MSMRPLGKLSKEGPAFQQRKGLERIAVRHRPADGTSQVQQSSKDQCDINLIVKRHASSGIVTHLNQQQPLHGDFSAVNDLLSAIEQVDQAYETFHSLPADVRKAAHNDPVVFLDMLDDPDALSELVQAGLVLTDEPSTGRQGSIEPEPVTGENTNTPEETTNEAEASEGKQTQGVS